jgi:hypothetical protein
MTRMATSRGNRVVEIAVRSVADECEASCNSTVIITRLPKLATSNRKNEDGDETGTSETREGKDDSSIMVLDDDDDLDTSYVGESVFEAHPSLERQSNLHLPGAFAVENPFGANTNGNNDDDVESASSNNEQIGTTRTIMDAPATPEETEATVVSAIVIPIARPVIEDHTEVFGEVLEADIENTDNDNNIDSSSNNGKHAVEKYTDDDAEDDDVVLLNRKRLLLCFIIIVLLLSAGLVVALVLAFQDAKVVTKDKTPNAHDGLSALVYSDTIHKDNSNSAGLSSLHDPSRTEEGDGDSNSTGATTPNPNATTTTTTPHEKGDGDGGQRNRYRNGQKSGEQEQSEHDETRRLLRRHGISERNRSIIPPSSGKQAHAARTIQTGCCCEEWHIPCGRRAPKCT